jgi:hypothetical protein
VAAFAQIQQRALRVVDLVRSGRLGEAAGKATEQQSVLGTDGC